MTQTPNKTNVVAELLNRKAVLKKNETKSPFGKFIPNRERNKNNSAVGPSRGGRKGN